MGLNKSLYSNVRWKGCRVNSWESIEPISGCIQFAGHWSSSSLVNTGQQVDRTALLVHRRLREVSPSNSDSSCHNLLHTRTCSVSKLVMPNTHRRRRRNPTVELSRIGGVNAPVAVGRRDPVYNFLCCWWHCWKRPRDAKAWETLLKRRGNDNLGWNDIQMYFKVQGHQKWHQSKASVWFPISTL